MYQMIVAFIYNKLGRDVLKTNGLQKRRPNNQQVLPRQDLPQSPLQTVTTA